VKRPYYMRTCVTTNTKKGRRNSKTMTKNGFDISTNEIAFQADCVFLLEQITKKTRRTNSPYCFKLLLPFAQSVNLVFTDTKTYTERNHKYRFHQTVYIKTQYAFYRYNSDFTKTNRMAHRKKFIFCLQSNWN